MHVYICVYMLACVCIHVYMCVCVHLYVYVCACMCVWMDVFVGAMVSEALLCTVNRKKSSEVGLSEMLKEKDERISGLMEEGKIICS